MKALTLHQPWASLVALEVKTIETRSWATKYRGPLGIHAGATIPDHALGRCQHYRTWEVGAFTVEKDNPRGSEPAYLLRGESLAWPYRLPLGAMVATCTLVDVVPIIDDDDESNPFERYPCVVSSLGSDLFPDGWLELYHSTLGDPIDPEGSGRSVPFEAAYGDFAPGRYAWLLDDILPIREPVPAKGRQSLWEWAA